MTIITLAKIGTNPTVTFAAEELARCLKAMDRYVLIDNRTYDGYDASVKGAIWVGLDGSVTPSERDDEISIDVKHGEGIITGANNRAMLIAAYRFLRELGCAWVRPGPDGEIFPEKTLDRADLNVSVRETPSYPHRGVCLEGSVINEHIINMIDWLPKVGMNTYFVQFIIPADFYNRYFKDTKSPIREPMIFSDEDIAHMWRACEEEILKRGLIYHAVGHGWTNMAFGVTTTAHDPKDPRISDEFRSYFAEIGGKRELNKNGLYHTQLCYSKKRVRDAITDCITEYARKNPAVSVIHFWLADGFNYHCECDECRALRPSDWYVMMLNELDEKLTAAGLKTKIVFLAYLDLLWEPVEHKIHNPDRFLLMFAPITRTYSNALYDFDKSEKIELPPFELNKLKFSKSVAVNAAQLALWQKDFSGDGFIFDYHLMWDHFIDPGFTACARTLHRDMCELEKFGLMGSVSCQQQRVAFPTGLPLWAMARGLWDKESKFEDVAREYYELAFGEDAEAVSEYLSKITELFDPAFMRCDNDAAFSTSTQRMDGVDKLVDSFKLSHIDKNKDKDASWKYLWYHAEHCKLYAAVVRAFALGDEAEKDESMKAFTDFTYRTEPVLHTVHDAAYFNGVYKGWLKKLYAKRNPDDVTILM